MIPSNHLIAQSTAHLFSVITRLSAGFLLLLTLDAQAMSRNPDEVKKAVPYTAASWHENADPDKDARRALEHGDYRLLGFATRGTSIPGVDPTLKRVYQAQCGLRFIEGFGDVIRSDEQGNQMKLASEYAERYNSLIMTGCQLAD